MTAPAVLLPAVLAAEHWRSGDHAECAACDRLAAVLLDAVDREEEA